MRLTVYFPENSPTSHEIVDNEITVGRLGDNDVTLDDGSVSGHHAKLVANDGVATLFDLESTNGSYVNGDPVIGERVLKDHDEIYFGGVRAVFMEEKSGEVASVAVVETTTNAASEQSAAVTAAPPAVSSGERPANFTYMSPLPRVEESKDKLATIAWCVGGVGVLAACYALFVIVLS